MPASTRDALLDDERIVQAQNPVTLGFGIRVPGTYKRLAADAKGEYGVKPLHRNGWSDLSASRYVRAMQSRRSLLVWKVYGERLDGWKNDDFPHEAIPGDPTSLQQHGKPVADTPQNRERVQLAYTGGIMPPPDAVAGTYVAPDGRKIKVAPLTAEDKLTLVRWIDLGCPIDVDPRYDPRDPAKLASYGWMGDDQRPTLALTVPAAGENQAVSRILVGMADAYSGLDVASFTVTADFPIDGVKPGENLAARFKAKSDGVHELQLTAPLKRLERGTLTVTVSDRQGNVTRIERTFSIK